MSNFVWQALLRLYWATMRFECLHQTINEDAIAGDGSRSFHWNPFQPHCLVMFFSMAHTVLLHWFCTEASQKEAGLLCVCVFCFEACLYCRFRFDQNHQGRVVRDPVGRKHLALCWALSGHCRAHVEEQRKTDLQDEGAGELRENVRQQRPSVQGRGQLILVSKTFDFDVI
jgi:hypothetical protein